MAALASFLANSVLSFYCSSERRDDHAHNHFTKHAVFLVDLRLSQTADGVSPFFIIAKATCQALQRSTFGGQHPKARGNEDDV
jgi:hypothetical protein